MSVELGEEISAEVNTRVRALEYLVDQKGLPGVVETVPSYRSLLVYYDPSVVGYDALCAQLAALAEQATTTTMPPAREVELPCCYEGELGTDLEAAAARLGLSVDELVRLHAGAGASLRATGASAPVTATVHGASARKRGPMSVNSSAAAPSALPTRRLASTNEGRSMGPEGGIPYRICPARPASCTVVCSPGSSTRIIGSRAGSVPPRRGPRRRRTRGG